MAAEAKMEHLHVAANSLQVVMLIDDFMHSKGQFHEIISKNMEDEGEFHKLHFWPYFLRL